MTARSFIAIKRRFELICELLPDNLAGNVRLELAESPIGDGTPHIETIEGRLHYVVSERGNEFERRVAHNEDELLYWLVTDLTSTIASAWEAKHRVPWLDSRRRWFAKEIQILNRVNPEWAARRSDEQARLLRDSP